MKSRGPGMRVSARAKERPGGPTPRAPDGLGPIGEAIRFLESRIADLVNAKEALLKVFEVREAQSESVTQAADKPEKATKKPAPMTRSERGRMGGRARWAKARAATDADDESPRHEKQPAAQERGSRFVCKWCGNPIRQKDQPMMIEIDGYKYHDKCALQKSEVAEAEERKLSERPREREARADYVR